MCVVFPSNASIKRKTQGKTNFFFIQEHFFVMMRTTQIRRRKQSHRRWNVVYPGRVKHHDNQYGSRYRSDLVSRNVVHLRKERSLAKIAWNCFVPNRARGKNGREFAAAMLLIYAMRIVLGYSVVLMGIFHSVVMPFILPISNMEEIDTNLPAPFSLKNARDASNLTHRCECVFCLKDIECGGLWKSGPFGMKPSGRIHLVISHCKHDLEWVSSFTNGVEIDSTTIITKCDENIANIPKNATVFAMPNVGRCDHNFAYISSNITQEVPTPTWVEDGDDNDLIVFLKDEESSRSLHQRGKWRSFREMLRIASLTGFGCAIRPGQYRVATWATMAREDMSAYAIVEKQNLFKMRRYKSRYGETYEDMEQNTKEPPFSSNYTNLGDWRKSLGLRIPELLTENCYGGSFAVTKRNIRRHSQTVYEKIMKSLSRGNNIEEGHFAERTWAALFANPLSSWQEDALLEYSTSICSQFAYEGILIHKSGSLIGGWFVWIPLQLAFLLALEWALLRYPYAALIVIPIVILNIGKTEV